MRILWKHRPSPAMVVALIALVVAMSGTAVAATNLVNGDKLIAKHTLSANRLRNHTVTATQIKTLRWHALTLENGWTAFTGPYAATPAYAKDAFGFVHLRGTVDGSAKTTNVIANLPPGFRPPSTHAWVPASSTTGIFDPQLVNLDILNSDGSIAIYNGTGANDHFVSLEGVEFFGG